MKTMVLVLVAGLAGQEATAAGRRGQATRSVLVRHISSGRHGPAAHSRNASGPAISARIPTFRAGVMTAPAAPAAPAGAARRSVRGAGTPSRRSQDPSWGSFTRPLSGPRGFASAHRGRRIGPLPKVPSDGGLSPQAPQPEQPPQEPATAGPQPKFGALIRSEGLGFRTAPAEPARLHAIEAGGSIRLDESRALSLANRGIHIGPRDTPPNPNPGGAVTGPRPGEGASGRNAITPNTP